MEWFRSLPVYAALAAAGLLGAAGDALINQWAVAYRPIWLLAGYAAWAVDATLLGLMLRLQLFSFSAAIVLFLMVNSAGAVLLDYSVLGGRPSGWAWLGIALAVAAMCCIEIGRGGAHLARPA